MQKTFVVVMDHLAHVVALYHLLRLIPDFRWPIFFAITDDINQVVIDL
jgi:hypothetical protein